MSQGDALSTWKSARRRLVRDLRKGDKFTCISGHNWTAGDWHKDGDTVRYSTRDDGKVDTFCANAEVVPCSPQQ